MRDVEERVVHVSAAMKCSDWGVRPEEILLLDLAHIALCCLGRRTPIAEKTDLGVQDPSDPRTHFKVKDAVHRTTHRSCKEGKMR